MKTNRILKVFTIGFLMAGVMALAGCGKESVDNTVNKSITYTAEATTQATETNTTTISSTETTTTTSTTTTTTATTSTNSPTISSAPVIETIIVTEITKAPVTELTTTTVTTAREVIAIATTTAVTEEVRLTCRDIVNEVVSMTNGVNVNAERTSKNLLNRCVTAKDKYIDIFMSCDCVNHEEPDGYICSGKVDFMVTAHIKVDSTNNTYSIEKIDVSNYNCISREQMIEMFSNASVEVRVC